MSRKLVSINDWISSRFETPPSLRTVRRWCDNGDIPAKKIGKRWFIEANKELQQESPPSVDELVNRVLKAS